ncbi:transcriptional regulator [Acetobacterium paludosum]|uniref:Transcriptional regulator n=1 Tax=Acetobacterium paludosum TaxID=52693 RepID=A0A923I3V9_9FIRM|nr:helix-turn-helix transcriptional regulator [Acetobacterium paludosum]MBC3889468.1 transcriptional regulator [Acetobacterium paludosum]
MKKQSTNMYEIHRINAGLKRFEAAEKLAISERSLDDYENFNFIKGTGRRPPDDVVIQMAEIYKAPHLPRQHYYENTEIGRKEFINIMLLDLREAFLKFQCELSDITSMEIIARNMVIDNQITENEAEEASRFVNELKELIEAATSLQYSLISKNTGIALREIIINERRPISHDRKRLYARI